MPGILNNRTNGYRISILGDCRIKPEGGIGNDQIGQAENLYSRKGAVVVFDYFTDRIFRVNHDSNNLFSRIGNSRPIDGHIGRIPWIQRCYRPCTNQNTVIPRNSFVEVYLRILNCGKPLIFDP